MKNSKKPTVSVIVATKNEEKNIESCLNSIRRQSYKHIEIIVVDNPKTVDKTVDIAKKYTSKVYSFGTERSAQRNYAISKSSGAILLFVDADMTLDKNVVSEGVEEIFKGVQGVIVPEKSVGTSFWSQCKALEKNCYIGDPLMEAPRFFEKKVFQIIGGYDDSMISSEDWDLRDRLVASGGKIGRTHSFITHNENNRSLLGILRKKYYYAKKAGPYIQKNVISFSNIKNFLIRPAFIHNWRLILRDPIHGFGMLFMVYLEFAIGGIGVIIFKPYFWKALFRFT